MGGSTRPKTLVVHSHVHHPGPVLDPPSPGPRNPSGGERSGWTSSDSYLQGRSGLPEAQTVRGPWCPGTRKCRSPGGGRKNTRVPSPDSSGSLSDLPQLRPQSDTPLRSPEVRVRPHTSSFSVGRGTTRCRLSSSTLMSLSSVAGPVGVVSSLSTPRPP